MLQVAFIKPCVVPASKRCSPPLPSIGQVKMALKLEYCGWFLKQYCKDLAPVVRNIITGRITQMQTSYLLLRHGLITPIAKVNPPKDIENDVCQISVLLQLAKVLEMIQLQLNS